MSEWCEFGFKVWNKFFRSLNQRSSCDPQVWQRFSWACSAEGTWVYRQTGHVWSSHFFKHSKSQNQKMLINLEIYLRKLILLVNYDFFPESEMNDYIKLWGQISLIRPFVQDTLHMKAVQWVGVVAFQPLPMNGVSPLFPRKLIGTYDGKLCT